MNKNIKYSQNFLTSEKVLNQIIKQLNLKETDTVYEIGTGKGHLTTKLAKISKQVTSIELDSHLFNLSSEKLKLNTRVTLIHQDILQFQFPNKQRYKIVGNIPYHLSTQIIKKVVFESHASDIYLIVEEGFYKRTLDIHRTLGLLLHTQVSIQQLLKLPAECFHPKPKVNSVLIKLTRHTTDVPDKYWKLYTYFVSKWVNREYRQLFTKNQFHQAMKHAKVNNLSTCSDEKNVLLFPIYHQKFLKTSFFSVPAPADPLHSPRKEAVASLFPRGVPGPLPLSAGRLPGPQSALQSAGLLLQAALAACR